MYSLRNTTAYRNLLQDIEWERDTYSEKSIIAVPRPSEGVVYLGEYDGFELVNNPTWAETYINHRRTNQHEIEDRASHLRDVVQSFKVNEWKAVSLALIPAWIRRTLFGRSTVARFHPVVIGQSKTLHPHTYLKKLFDEPNTLDAIHEKDTFISLINLFRPEPFEHLVVALMQCEYAELRWLHVGGSGDGGVDGIAFNETGTTEYLIQCKWQWYGEDIALEAKDDRKIITAYLLGPEQADTSTRKYLDGKKIARLVEEHRHVLPQAKAMGLL